MEVAIIQMHFDHPYNFILLILQRHCDFIKKRVALAYELSRLSKSKSIMPTDETLLHQYQESGNQQLIGELYTRYMHLVYGLCLKYLKDAEASQDAVMDIYEVISGKLLQTQVRHFKSWLYMVSKNHCLMKLRKNNPEVHTEVFMESADTVHLKEEKLDLEQDLVSLERCLEQLKSEQKRCVKSFFIDKKTYQDVSDALGLPLKKVKSHIQNGKRNLKICMEKTHA